MPKFKVTQQDALEQAFLNLCRQYAEMGEQLKAISTIISPILQGTQKLEPEILFEVEGNPCADCKGTGAVDDLFSPGSVKKCPTCNGKGSPDVPGSQPRVRIMSATPSQLAAMQATHNARRKNQS